MAALPQAPVYSELVDFIVGRISPEEILEFKVSPTAQARADKLIQRLKIGKITPAETAELEVMGEFDLLAGVLKARALAMLKHE